MKRLFFIIILSLSFFSCYYEHKQVKKEIKIEYNANSDTKYRTSIPLISIPIGRK